MRRKVKKPDHLKPDIKFGRLDISKFINHVMQSGKKNAAREIVYGAFETIKEKDGQDPMEVFELAMQNTGPMMEVRSRRIGGANYQVPREVRPERRDFLAMKWIVDAAKSKSGRPMKAKLADEILAASKNEGEAVKKRENTHKMAEANKAFAHFSW